MRRLAAEDQGYVLITALLVLAVISIVGAGALGWAATSARMARQAMVSEQAFYMANAGLEEALARANAGQLNPNQTLQHTMTIAPGLQGSYQVTLASQQDGTVLATSTGTVRSTSRTLTARLRLGGLSPAYQYLTFLGEPLDLQHVDACGDLYAYGDIEVKHTHIWGKTTAQDPSSPCTSIRGTGKLVSTGGVTVDKSVVDGGVYPFAKPIAMPIIDIAALKSRATAWWVTDSSKCSQKPPGATCQVMPKKGLTISGAQTYNHAIIYVEGQLDINNLRYRGAVTFVAEGEISISGVTGRNSSCAPKEICTAAFISGAQISVDGEVHGYFLVKPPGSFEMKNHSTIYGNILAGSLGKDKHILIHPPDMVGIPPALPGADGSAGFVSWGS
jgi:type II secretory pathway pseudopilin PulG